MDSFKKLSSFSVSNKYHYPFIGYYHCKNIQCMDMGCLFPCNFTRMDICSTWTFWTICSTTIDQINNEACRCQNSRNHSFCLGLSSLLARLFHVIYFYERKRLLIPKGVFFYPSIITCETTRWLIKPAHVKILESINERESL